MLQLNNNITIKNSFLEVGLTQSEGDSVHSTIEREAKGHKIFTLHDWTNIIATAKLKKPHYKVINGTFDMIFDFKQLLAQMK